MIGKVRQNALMWNGDYFSKWVVLKHVPYLTADLHYSWSLLYKAFKKMQGWSLENNLKTMYNLIIVILFIGTIFLARPVVTEQGIMVLN